MLLYTKHKKTKSAVSTKDMGSLTHYYLVFGLKVLAAAFVMLLLFSILEGTMHFWTITAAEDNVIPFSPADQFAIPNYNSSISFAAGGSYESATFYDNGTWHFASLALNSYTLNLSARGAPPGGIVTGRDVLPYLVANGAFSVSAKDCNVTITGYEPLTQYNPYSGWLNYTVTGTGEQIFDLNFPGTAFYWNITIDGEMKIQNESWTQTNNNLIKVTGAINNVCINYDHMPISRDGPQTFPWLQVTTATIVVTLLVVVIIFLVRKRQNKGNH
jgi:hypothetical protein